MDEKQGSKHKAR